MINIESELKEIAYKKIKLNDRYRFFNSNYHFDDNVIPFFKHNAIIEKLKNRIKFSDGGTFLITGLRGVGKSTLVKKALNELKNDKVYYLPVFISLSREIEYKKLLFETVRRLYETILDKKLFNKIDNEIINDIVLSYSRTSLSMSNNTLSTKEIDASLSDKLLEKKILVKGKLTRQVAKEASFLTYADDDVEHDLVRIIELLNGNKMAKIKTVLIFDEIDKLTINDKGSKYLEKVLGKMKTLLSSVGMISIFIGGLDLYQKWNDDMTKMNSLYDSIFSWHQYVPCIWDSTESLFDLISEKQYVYEQMPEVFSRVCCGQYLNIIKPSFQAFLIFINFKSKGIPRKIYSEFNRFVVWNKTTPYFQITEMDIKEIVAYTGIWKKISSIFEDKLYKTVIEMDLTYLICFNLIEYFFAHSNEKFTIRDIEKALVYKSTLSPIDMNQIIHDLIAKFEEQHIIQELSGGELVVSDRTIQQEGEVTIKDKTLLNGQYAKEDIGEDKENNECMVDDSFKRKVKRYKSKVITSFWDSYEAKKKVINNSAMSIFYVENKMSHKKYVAILYNDKQQKKMRRDILDVQDKCVMVSKYLLNTKNIAIGSYIKTSLVELYDGYLLTHLIKSEICTKYVLLIIEQVLDFIAEINRQGYFNANIKANNIVINQHLNVKFLDVKGLVKLNSKKIPILTVGYAAPEMYTDKYDCRCDIYSIGVLLWEMISGRCLSETTFERHVEFQFLKRPAKCSRKLWNIILKATKYNPDERYQNAGEFLQDIRLCKEYIIGKEAIFKNVSLGIVDNISDNNAREIIVENEMTSNWGHTAPLQDKQSETVILNVEKPISEKAYLYRIATDEIRVISNTPFTIGKDKENVDFYVGGNDAISRKHAGIVTFDNKYYLFDYGASNGTNVNGVCVPHETEKELMNGDIIKLANEEFVFRKLENGV